MDDEQIKQDIENMLSSDGWQHVKSFIDDRILDHKNQLQTCALEDVMKHRHKIEAYTSIYTQINSLQN